MLHTMHCSPWKGNIYEMLQMIKKDDDLLLMQDAVFGVIKNSDFVEILINTPAITSVLKPDTDARGITSQISNNVNIINFSSFVDLVIKHTNQMNW